MDTNRSCSQDEVEDIVQKVGVQLNETLPLPYDLFRCKIIFFYFLLYKNFMDIMCHAFVIVVSLDSSHHSINGIVAVAQWIRAFASQAEELFVRIPPATDLSRKNRK